MTCAPESPGVRQRARGAVWLGVALSLSFALTVHALVDQQFEVASVKPAREGQRKGRITGGPGTSDPGLITITNYPLQLLIQKAYGLTEYEYRGPEWARTERYDIVAKLLPSSAPADVNAMLQHLLEERLQLKYHREPEQITMYDLTVSKAGTKLVQTRDIRPGQHGTRPMLGPRGQDGFPHMDQEYVRDVGASTLIIQGTAKTVAVNESMDRFAEHLTDKLHHPVRNRTSLTGTYDFSFLWSAVDFDDEPVRPSGSSVIQVAAGDSIFAAVEKSLGLHLEKRKSSISVFVVDSLERKPVEN